MVSQTDQMVKMKSGKKLLIAPPSGDDLSKKACTEWWYANDESCFRLAHRLREFSNCAERENKIANRIELKDAEGIAARITTR